MMGKRGAQPAPTALKLVRGDRPSRINLDEPQPMDGLPVCPAQADDEVRAVWDYTLQQLSHMRIVSPADRDTLFVYCEAVVAHRRASRDIAERGVMVPGMDRGVEVILVKNAAIQIQRDAATLIRSYAQDFALNPAARSAIKMADLEPAKEQGAGRLLSG